MSTLTQAIRLARVIPKQKLEDRANDSINPMIQSASELVSLPYPAARITPTAQDVIAVVANFYDLGVIDILSDRRTLSSARIRQVACHMLRLTTLLSLTEMGRAMGRDHTTIMHSMKRVAERLETDERLGDEIELLKLKITDLFNARMRATKCVT